MAQYYNSDPIVQSAIDQSRQHEEDWQKKRTQAAGSAKVGKWGYQGLKGQQYADAGFDFAQFFQQNPTAKIPAGMRYHLDRPGKDQIGTSIENLLGDYEKGGGFLDIIGQYLNPDPTIAAARKFGREGIKHYGSAEIAQMSGIAPAVAESTAAVGGAEVLSGPATSMYEMGAGTTTAAGAGGAAADTLAVESLAGTTAAAEGGLLASMKAGAMANPLAILAMILAGVGVGAGKRGSALNKFSRKHFGGGVNIPK